MNRSRVAAEIDAEISRLQQAKALILNEAPLKRGPGRPAKSDPKPAKKAAERTPLSTEARARIADAQKKRWARAKKSKKEALTQQRG